MANNSYSFKTLIITLGRSVEKIILFLTSIILSRYLPQSEYGSYRQVLLVSGLLITILNFGIPHSINFFLPQLNKEKQKSFMIQTLIFQIGLGLFSFIVLWISADFIGSAFGNSELKTLIRIFAFYPLFIIPSMSYSNIFICINKVKLSSILSVSLGFIKLFLILSGVLFNSSVKTILLLIIVSSMIQFIIVVFIVFKHFMIFSFKLSLSDFYKQIKFATPIGISTILGVLIIKIDQLMVSSSFNVEEYAVYSVGTLEIPFINILTVAGMAVITPYLVKQYKDDRMDLFINKWCNSIIKISYIIFPVTVFFIFFAEETILTLYTERYSQSSEIFRIYLFRLFVKITFFGHILLALGKPKIIFYFTLITLALNIALNILLIKTFGIIGAALATILSAFLISVLQLTQISKFVRINLKNIWPWKSLLLILFVSVVSASLAALLKLTEINNLYTLIVGFLFFIILFFIISQKLLSRFLPSQLHYKELILAFKGNNNNEA